MTTELNKPLDEHRILVVEDSPTQRDHVIDICKQCGLNNIVGAVNGQDALEKMATQEFDLALIDLEMPVMDGVELLRHVAQKKLLPAIVIISSKDPSLILSVGTMAEEDGLKVVGTFQKPMTAEYIQCSISSMANSLDMTDADKVMFNIPPEDLVSAIENDQIELYYQPKVSLKGLVLSGVEALARWQHPTQGNISPLEFVSMAERFGLVSKMTEKLLAKALQQKNKWQKRGINFHLAFNLSPLSLTDKGLADYLCDEVEKYAVKPDSVILEITENAVSGEISTAIETLARLRLKGFRIAIDDFGTGYANAQQLSRVPATELKIDRCLINNVSTKPQQQSILTRTVQMAQDLGYKTVAEGVEQPADFKFIQSLDMDLVQGYMVAKPMSPGQLEKWIATELSKLRQALKLSS